MYALIIGASGDIGEAIAVQLASEGWSLYCHYNSNMVKVDQLILNLQERYPKQDFFKLQADLTSESDIDKIISNLFQVDALIFSSGRTVYRLLSETTTEEINRLWKIHLYAPIRLCQLLQTKLSSQQFGHIILIGSVYGNSGSAMEVVYSTMKGAQISFAKAYSQEIISLGISINVVAPGAIQTAMNQNWSESEIDELVDAIPAKRIGTPQEVADVVSHIVKMPTYFTGGYLPVSGGWLL